MLYLSERRLHGEREPIGHRGYVVDCQGNEIWRKEKAGAGRPIKLAGREADHVFCTPPGRPPVIIDGMGEAIQRFDMPPFTYQVDRFDDGDTGIRCRHTIADTDGDGRQELLAYNRTHL